MQSNNNILNRIANHLLVNGRFLDNLGLFRGRMGVVIFFYHYSRYTNNPIYYEFAEELLDDLFEEIHDRLPIDFKDGYLGIGWGIQYLACQKFINEDVDCILEDIDKKIMERDIRRITDFSLETGLEGFFHYILARLQNYRDVRDVFDERYYLDLKYIINMPVATPLSNLSNDTWKLYTTKKSSYILSEQFSKFYYDKVPYGDKVYEWRLGLVNGCAGIGLKTMNI
ncbi:lanthionine synthetase LanC family protein [Capnocytophaga felis]|nr:lanthionine synthetase LanC family protein [Capnocytophaga felis]